LLYELKPSTGFHR